MLTPRWARLSELVVVKRFLGAAVVLILICGCAHGSKPVITRIESFCANGVQITQQQAETALNKVQNYLFNESYFTERNLRKDAQHYGGFESWFHPVRLPLSQMAAALSEHSGYLNVDAMVMTNERVTDDGGKAVYLEVLLPPSFKAARKAWYLFPDSMNAELCQK